MCVCVCISQILPSYSSAFQDEEGDSDEEVADSYEDSLEDREEELQEPQAKRRAVTMKVRTLVSSVELW